jgi:hypothetical protein
MWMRRPTLPWKKLSTLVLTTSAALNPDKRGEAVGASSAGTGGSGGLGPAGPVSTGGASGVPGASIGALASTLSLASGGVSTAGEGGLTGAGSICSGRGGFGGSQKVVVDRTRQAVMAYSAVVGRRNRMLISKIPQANAAARGQI